MVFGYEIGLHSFSSNKSNFNLLGKERNYLCG